MTTSELHIPVAEILPECITDRKCNHGYNGTERSDYEWQHDVRRVQYELEKEGTLQRVNGIWSLRTAVGISQDEDNPFIDDLFLEADKEKLKEELASVTEKSPETETFNGIRFKRDRLTVAKLKKLRDYKCQICGASIRMKNGKFYVEGAHIVEKRKSGPELPRNILILCPNHHKEFDLGSREILEYNSSRVEFSLNDEIYTIDLSL